ncbi:hypothetical protein PGT21_033509 [Puccinia graminis f. sp. tritici]|uniref:Uncharacterized protein n=1 Tax=Puccinia graminis f. sp. tritici TaxID=56615 RepID=A0A5B0NE11_PUCGR|nr:hypothetical protein PGT21_033509 [Puccinia graminis f. sp. tritici]
MPFVTSQSSREGKLRISLLTWPIPKISAECLESSFHDQLHSLGEPGGSDSSGKEPTLNPICSFPQEMLLEYENYINQVNHSQGQLSSLVSSPSNFLATTAQYLTASSSSPKHDENYNEKANSFQTPTTDNSSIMGILSQITPKIHVNQVGRRTSQSSPKISKKRPLTEYLKQNKPNSNIQENSSIAAFNSIALLKDFYDEFVQKKQTWSCTASPTSFRE